MERYPQSADGYELLKECGHGSTAKVWIAKCKESGRRVAIKVFDFSLPKNTMAAAMEEARLLQELQHPNVLHAMSAFEHESSFWVVMPYLAGGSLQDIMHSRFAEGFNENTVATIMKEVLKGLQFLHSRGIIHRDLKASNVILGEDGSVVIGDFGVATKMVRASAADAEFSARLKYLQRSTFIGTPCYMAPEVIGQTAGYDQAADVWSCGIMLYELATGKLPFKSDKLAEIIVNVVQDEPPKLEGKRFSESLKDLVSKCLQKVPERRLTASEVLEHRFFLTHARDAAFLVKKLLSGPPMSKRLSAPLIKKFSSLRMSQGSLAAAAGAGPGYAVGGKVACGEVGEDAKLALATIRRLTSKNFIKKASLNPLVISNCKGVAFILVRQGVCRSFLRGSGFVVALAAEQHKVDVHGSALNERSYAATYLREPSLHNSSVGGGSRQNLQDSPVSLPSFSSSEAATSSPDHDSLPSPVLNGLSAQSAELQNPPNSLESSLQLEFADAPEGMSRASSSEQELQQQQGGNCSAGLSVVHTQPRESTSLSNGSGANAFAALPAAQQATKLVEEMLPQLAASGCGPTSGMLQSNGAVGMGAGTKMDTERTTASLFHSLKLRKLQGAMKKSASSSKLVMSSGSTFSRQSSHDSIGPDEASMRGAERTKSVPQWAASPLARRHSNSALNSGQLLPGIQPLHTAPYPALPHSLWTGPAYFDLFVGGIKEGHSGLDNTEIMIPLDDASLELFKAGDVQTALEGQPIHKVGKYERPGSGAMLGFALSSGSDGIYRVAISGAHLQANDSLNERAFGSSVTSEEILSGHWPAPASMEPLYSELTALYVNGMKKMEAEEETVLHEYKMPYFFQ